MPGTAELAALNYTGASPVLTAEDFRVQLHSPLGRRVRWWKSYEVPADTPGRTKQNRLLIEQELADEVRVLIGQVDRDTVGMDGTLLPKGTMTISNDVRSIEFARRDQIVITNVSWLARQIVTRGNTDTDTLAQPHVVGIAGVLLDGTLVDRDEYEATATGIQWDAGAGPEAGQQYAVEYRYHPLIEYLMQSESLMQVGGDGLLLPQRGYGRVV